MSARTKTCSACGEDLPLAVFRKVGRGLSKTCSGCESGASAAEETAAEPNVLLQIRPGFELRAWVDGDGDLVLAQSGEVESRIYLAPHQVKQLAEFLSPVKSGEEWSPATETES
jgi:hypothetical protein